MHWLLYQLQKFGGYYECPKSPGGELLGPLVGYAGKYQTADGQTKQYVGTTYFNFSQGEKWPEFRNACSYKLEQEVAKRVPKPNLIIGMPMGGIVLATELANRMNLPSIFMEKQVVSLTTQDRREQSRLVLQRHELQRGHSVLLVEDVCNNFSTTLDAIQILENMGSEVVGIACAINRSAQDHFRGMNYTWPVASVVHIPTEQWKQDDPAVANHITAGNVVWKPKNEWSLLQAAMERWTTCPPNR